MTDQERRTYRDAPHDERMDEAMGRIDAQARSVRALTLLVALLSVLETLHAAPDAIHGFIAVAESVRHAFAPKPASVTSVRPGASGQLLVSNGSGAAPTWEEIERVPVPTIQCSSTAGSITCGPLSNLHFVGRDFSDIIGNWDQNPCSPKSSSGFMSEEICRIDRLERALAVRP
jgi:hypothetical protein